MGVILRTPSTGGAEALRWAAETLRTDRKDDLTARKIAGRSGETGASEGCDEAVALRNWRGGLVFGLWVLLFDIDDN